jgi:uncharacterized membrane protein YadS
MVVVPVFAFLTAFYSLKKSTSQESNDNKLPLFTIYFLYDRTITSNVGQVYFRHSANIDFRTNKRDRLELIWPIST